MPPNRLDELEREWQPERPTDTKRRRIEQTGPPVSYPPPSTATLIAQARAWLKARGWVAIVVVAMGGGAGVTSMLADRLGLATKVDLRAVEERAAAKQAEIEVKHSKELAAMRREAGRCAIECRDAKSQVAGAVEVSESAVEGKPRRGR